MNLDEFNGNSYNNADSFAMAFDEAWNNYDFKKNNNLNIEEKIKTTLKIIENHPFLQDNPIESRNIAFFRIKLLGLT